MRRWLILFVVACCLWPAAPGSAHELRPAFAELKETSAGRFQIVFKRPALGELALSLSLSLDPACRETSPQVQFLTGSSAVRRWTVDCGSRGLAGRTLTVVGLERTLTDTLVLVTYASGGSENALLRPSSPSVTFKGPAGGLEILRDYTLLGVDHILGGLDHLLFVLCLVLLVRGAWSLFKTVTAFTVAHSITLGAATLGFVDLPPGPVEALIALSIVFLAVEVLVRPEDRKSLMARRPWVVAFAFGLLHGFGFAGALSDVGLPATHILLALLAFNIGVELGQIAFIALALATIAAHRSITTRDFRWDAAWVAPRLATIYAVGGVAAYWLINRVAGIVA